MSNRSGVPETNHERKVSDKEHLMHTPKGTLSSGMRFRQTSTSGDDLFVSSGARIVLTADIDVLDDLAVTFVSIVIEAKA